MQGDGPAAAAREIDAFLATLDDVPPNAVTACRGWTTREIMAHLASGADAFANQVEAHLEGREVPEFGGWVEREIPYRQFDDRTLRRRVETSERRMTEAFAAMLTDDPSAQVPEIGWGLPIGELVKHMRQEYAVHRWDLIGDDEPGLGLLGQADLLTHSVTLLGDSLLAVGMARDPAPEESLAVRLRCADQPDLLVSIDAGVGRLTLEDPVDAPEIIETDPAARLLLLWGRRPTDSRRVRSTLSADRLARLQTLLSGY